MRNKIHPYISRILQIQISFFIFFTSFLFSVTKACLLCQLRKAHAVFWAVNPTLGLETPEQNDFDQFWKFKFNFKHFPRNTQFLSFDGPSNYLYLFKNHWQTFSWPGERQSSQFRVTKIRFGLIIKYLSELFFVDLCCWKGIFCLVLSQV